MPEKMSGIATKNLITRTSRINFVEMPEKMSGIATLLADRIQQEFGLKCPKK